MQIERVVLMFRVIDNIGKILLATKHVHVLNKIIENLTEIKIQI